jgi:hypothetical protein
VGMNTKAHMMGRKLKRPCALKATQANTNTMNGEEYL